MIAQYITWHRQPLTGIACHYLMMPSSTKIFFKI